VANAAQPFDDDAPAFSFEGGRDVVPEFARQTLDALAASAGTAIIGTDIEGVITHWGAGAEALYGWTAGDVVGTSVFDRTASGLAHEVEQVRETLNAGGAVRRWETERLRKDGTRAIVQIDLELIYDDARNAIGVASIHRDVTEQRRIERALRSAESQYRTLVETLPAAIYLVTLEEESRVLYISPRAEELLGVPLDEATPSRVRELLHPDDRERVLAEVQRVNAELEPTTLEYRIVRPDGTIVWLEDTSVVLPGEGGEPSRSQGYVFDISDRKRLEEQLLQSQKMDAVGQLAGGIAHDFNNILTAISGYTEFALGRAGGDAALRDDLLEIRRAATRAATLTKQILAFGRRQVFQSRPLDLNDAIDETKKLILRVIGEHIEVVSHLEVPLGAVMADPSQITQVLVNLAVNARDAMPGGGRLTIETLNVAIDEPEAVATALEPGPYVLLRFTDDGAGMAQETVRRAFEPFFTTKGVGEGTGLGLSMVYGIAQQSGGRAAVESVLGEGTVVSMYLPRIDAAPTPIPRAERVAEPVASEGTVLLVEDEDVIRRLATKMLAQHGYTVLSAGDPLEALQLAAEVGEIDLLLTDVVMPSMNGPELARLLVAERPGLRVLFTSGYPAGAFAGRGVLDDDEPLLQKPFTSSDLVAAVRDAISR